MIKECEKCKVDFDTTNEKRRFCSRKCANSHTHSEETKLKISEGNKQALIKKGKIKIIEICPICGEEFLTYKGKQIYCSVKCAIQNNLLISNLSYRQDELPIKEKLDILFNSSFKKERIQNFYIDFANSKFLKEYQKQLID